MRQMPTGLTLIVALGALAPVGHASAPKRPNSTTAAVEFRDLHGDTDATPPIPPDAITIDGAPYITAMPLGTKITKARSIPQSATSAGWDRPLRPVDRYGASRFVLRQRSSSE
jgi:hypothetical protein